MKKIKTLAIALSVVLILLTFAGCTKPVPPEQQAIDVYNAATEMDVKNKQVDGDNQLKIKYSTSGSTMEFTATGYSKEFFDENGNLSNYKQYIEMNIYGNESKITQTYLDGKYYYSDGTNKYMSPISLDEWNANFEEKSEMGDFKAEDFANRTCVYDKENKIYTVGLSEYSAGNLSSKSTSYEEFVRMFLADSKLSDVKINLVADSDKMMKKFEIYFKFDGTADNEGQTVELTVEMNTYFKNTLDITPPADEEHYVNVGNALALEDIISASNDFGEKPNGKFKYTVDVDVTASNQKITFKDVNVGEYGFGASGFFFDLTENVDRSGNKNEYKYSYSNSNFVVTVDGQTQTQTVTDAQAKNFVLTFLEDLRISVSDIKNVRCEKTENESIYYLKYDDSYNDYYAKKNIDMLGLDPEYAKNLNSSLDGNQIVVLDKDGAIKKVEININSSFTYYGEKVTFVSKMVTEVLPDGITM